MKKLILCALLLSACGQGPQGIPGKDGLSAPLGPQLPDGTPVTPVQFCPNTTTYPTTFSEVAFCINNNLYAVYSANDGFLTLIPPGTYNSNGINSTCTFQVLPNCMVLDN